MGPHPLSSGSRSIFVLAVSRFLNIFLSTLKRLRKKLYRITQEKGMSLFLRNRTVQTSLSEINRNSGKLHRETERIQPKAPYPWRTQQFFEKNGQALIVQQRNNCKTLMENRQKVLYVSKKMKENRQETLERITNNYGIQLRINRSIQTEQIGQHLFSLKETA